jgi:glycerophosphodiester phosphodiesterase
MNNGGFKVPKFVVIGHRGNGMNVLQSTDRRMRAIKENSIMSFNAASSFPLDFIEFDVQVYHHHHSSHFLSIFVSQ